MDKRITVPKRKLKGEDGYKTFSLRIPNELYDELNDFTGKTELSRNEVTTILLREALNIAYIEGDEENQEK